MDDYDFTGKRILIAEDDQESFKFLQELLEDTHAQIIHVDNGLDAIELCRNMNPDVVLMDILLPKMNGYEAIEKIVALQPSKCIIAITAFAFAEDRIKCLQLGCKNYISKPIDIDVLMNTLQKCLRKT